MASDYYEIFGVAPDADIETIKQRYRVLVRENHPDVSASEDAHARMQLILEAWSVLSQPSARKRYDLSRREAAQRNTHAAPNAPHRQNRSATARHSPSNGTPKPRAGSTRPQVDVNPRASNPRTRLLTMVFEAAQLYHQEGSAAEAISLCNRVLKSDPKNSEAAALLGDIYSEQGRHDLGLLMYKRAMQNQPNNFLYRQKWEALQQRLAPDTAAEAPAPPAAATATPPARNAEPTPTPPATEAPRAAGCGAPVLFGLVTTGAGLAWWLSSL